MIHPSLLTDTLTQLQQEISERQQVEKELKASQQFLQLVLDTLPQRVFWKDRQCRFLGCNQLVAQDAGVQSPTEMLGKDDYDFPWKEQAPLYQADDKAVMASGTPRINYEEPQIRADGTEGWVQTSKIPLRDEQGTVIGVLGAYEDITARKTTELALRQSEEKFRSLVSHIPGAVYQCLCDANYTMEFISDAIEDISGYPATDFIGNRIRAYVSIIHPDDLASVALNIEQAITMRQSFVLEYRVIHRDGSVRWVSERGKAIFDHNDALAYLEGVIFDVSDRRAAEQSLKEQIRLSAFRAAIDSILSREDNLQLMLKQCCEQIVYFLDAVCARIWTLNPHDQVLELQASAGLYAPIKDVHSQIPVDHHIPVDQFKIELIAKERQPHLTNDVLNDPHVEDKEWARQIGMVAFAGYPLMVEDELIGVVALFASHILNEQTLDVLSFIANELALGIRRKQAELALLRSEEIGRAHV